MDRYFEMGNGISGMVKVNKKLKDSDRQMWCRWLDHQKENERLINGYEYLIDQLKKTIDEADTRIENLQNLIEAIYKVGSPKEPDKAALKLYNDWIKGKL